MNAAQLILVALVRIYRWVLSPAKTLVFGPLGRCRFVPSCSAYALDAVRKHGALYGSWLAFKRVARCHPWGGCGCDPVPAVRLGRGWRAGVPGVEAGRKASADRGRGTSATRLSLAPWTANR